MSQHTTPNIVKIYFYNLNVLECMRGMRSIQFESTPLDYWRQRREDTISSTQYYKEELIAKACHPDRKDVFQWICDIDELKYMNDDWVL